MILKITKLPTKKIPAQALYFALLVATIGVLSLTALVALNHSYRIFEKKSASLIQLIYNNKEYFLDTHQNTSLITSDTIPLPDQKDERSVSSYYGCWVKAYHESSFKHHKITTVGFLGAEINKETPSLYLQDGNAPLVLVGNTSINGNVYLPASGIKPGVIQGEYYTGTPLNINNYSQSNNQLPQISTQWRQYFNSLISNSYSNHLEPISLTPKISNSFLEDTKIIHSNEQITLSNTIIGNIIVKSSSKVVILPSANIIDVIIVAPTIEVKSGVKGQFQCFATNKISIENNVTLNYPSALILDHSKNSNNKINSRLSIGKNSTISGSVLFFKKKRTSQFEPIKTNVFVNQGSSIIGEIYCNGNLELKGTVEGSIYTKNFITNAYGSKYVNHLYNGIIKNYPTNNYGGIFFQKTKHKKLMKWLY